VGLVFTRPRGARDNARIARALHAYGTANADLLGLMPDATIWVHSFHEVYRPDPDGQLQIQMVAELVQRMNVRRDPNDAASPWFTFRGGTTLIIDENGIVRYSIQKRLRTDSPDNPRLARQRAYYQQIDEGAAGLNYVGLSPFAGRNSAFSLIHRGY
jgi:hypothetical protein